jgi:HEAT repeat protein
MRRSSPLLFILLTFLAQGTLQAEIVLRGFVRSEATNGVISGAMVSSSQAKKPDITDQYGKFSLPLRDTVKIDTEIVVRVVAAGYQAIDTKVIASDNNVLDIQLPQLPPRKDAPPSVINKKSPEISSRKGLKDTPDLPPVDYFIKQIASNNESDRLNAIVALGDMGHDAAKAGEAISGALMDSSFVIREKAALALSDIRPTSKIVINRLIIALKDTRSPSLRVASARALGSIGPDAKTALPALAVTLKDSDEQVRISAAIASVKIARLAQEPIVTILIEALETKKDYQEQVLEALALLGPEGKAASAKVCELITGSYIQDNIRNKAAVAIDRMGDSSRRECLRKVVGDMYTHTSTLSEWLAADPSVKPDLADAMMQEVDNRDEQLMGAYNDEGWFNLLLKIEPRATEKVSNKIASSMRNKLAKNQFDTRDINLATKLISLRPDSCKEVAPFLFTLAKHYFNLEIETSAHDSIVDRCSQTALPYLLGLINSEDPEEAAWAARDVLKIDPTRNKDMATVLARLATKKGKSPVNERSRIFALHLLGEIGADAAVVPEDVAGILNEKNVDDDILVAAIASLRKIGQPFPKGAITDLVRLVIQGYACEETIAHNKGSCFYAAEALVSLGDSAVDPLIEKLDFPEENARNRVGDTLSKIKSPRVVKALTAMLTDNKSVYARLGAVETLGKLGPAAQEAIPALKRASQDRNSAIREASTKALQKLDPED